MKYVILSILVVTVIGCGTIGAKAKPFIAAYCSKPISERTLAREIIAAEIAPNRIEVTCAADK